MRAAGPTGYRDICDVDSCDAGVAPPPGWWNGRHGRLKSGCRKACGFDPRPGHEPPLSDWTW
jgi:hypothetical protein